MSAENIIYNKLESFIRKFYINELIKGAILFFVLGFVYFILTLLIEYFLWLKPADRTILFFVFVFVEFYLLFRFIFIPLLKLFKLKRGIDYQQAATIIGKHFNDVDDSLINFLQLKNKTSKSELLTAAIEQKSYNLRSIPFTKAVNLGENRKYFFWIAVPLLLFSFLYFINSESIVSQSFNRIIHFNTSFSRPAPFRITILNKNLYTVQNKDFILRVNIDGNVIPERATIHFEKQSYFMESDTLGFFEFRFPHPNQNIKFFIKANDVISKEYQLNVFERAAITNFEMYLRYPLYLKRSPQKINGTGNAIIPEGTKIFWKIATQATDSLFWKSKDVTKRLTKKDNFFLFSKLIFKNTDYELSVSNSKNTSTENLNYSLTVIKDFYPTITTRVAPDSLVTEYPYVFGQVSDDNGLHQLQIVYYPNNNPNAIKRAIIPIKNSTFDQFIFSFPNTLPIQKGLTYLYYFEVFDNDVFHHFKSTKSSLFTARILTNDETQEQVLQLQNDNNKVLSNTIKDQTNQLIELDKLQILGKEKNQFEFKEQQKVSEFLKSQKSEQQIFKDYIEKLKDNLEKNRSKETNDLKNNLINRLKNASQEAVENKKLLEELQKLNDKIDSDELIKKLDKYKQQTKSQTKNIAQLVELTKKFYVENKSRQIAEKIEKLSEKQIDLSKNDKANTTDKQSNINDQFKEIQTELTQLKKENSQLKAPIDLPNEQKKESEIVLNLEKALEELRSNKLEKALTNQKSGANMMKELSKSMLSSIDTSEQEQMKEDVKNLRQITDNLLSFSYQQELVMKQFNASKAASSSYNRNIRTQQNLKQQFKHISDSLFALSLRNPMISEDLNKQIASVEYNLNNAIQNLSNSQLSKGVSHQQYAISDSNFLADKLSNVLFTMQTTLSKTGSGIPKRGSGQEIQLMDIIKAQTEISKKIQPNQKGDSGKSENKNQDGTDNEAYSESVLQIYNEQQKLREALENGLNGLGLDSKSNDVVLQMRQLEKQLLNKGFKPEIVQKANNIRQKLLELLTSLQQQGDDTKRESITNKNSYPNTANSLPKPLSEYFQTVEILNRQSLPLRSNFEQKVNNYFNKYD